MPYPLMFLAAASALLATLVCGGCADRSHEEPKAPNAAAGENSGRLVPGAPRANLSKGAVNGDQVHDGGPEHPNTSDISRAVAEIDIANRYSSAVMVTTNALMKEGGEVECSGVLIAPRLVLTAAHCVCASQTTDDDVEKSKIIDAATCVTKAIVTAVAYEPPTPGEDLGYVNREYMGQVRPHPGFKMTLDHQGRVASSRSDFAVVLLDKPVKNVAPSGIAENEFGEGEAVVMVAFTSDEMGGGVDRRRSFSKTRILSVFKGADGRYLVQRSALSDGKGAIGGPCLNEVAQESVLIGVVAGFLDNQAVCASLDAYRGWLREEIQQAVKTKFPQRTNVP